MLRFYVFLELDNWKEMILYPVAATNSIPTITKFPWRLLFVNLHWILALSQLSRSCHIVGTNLCSTSFTGASYYLLISNSGHTTCTVDLHSVDRAGFASYLQWVDLWHCCVEQEIPTYPVDGSTAYSSSNWYTVCNKRMKGVDLLGRQTLDIMRGVLCLHTRSCYISRVYGGCLSDYTMGLMQFILNCHLDSKI